jgi:hypothetical protein
MTYWYYFWMFDFAIAGSAFIFILFIVAVKGFADLMSMFRLLDQEQHEARRHPKT